MTERGLTRGEAGTDYAHGMRFGGAGRDRTGDLVNAIHARSQLRHSPTLLFMSGDR